jgi:hypothetical protein
MPKLHLPVFVPYVLLALLLLLIAFYPLLNSHPTERILLVFDTWGVDPYKDPTLLLPRTCAADPQQCLESLGLKLQTGPLNSGSQYASVPHSRLGDSDFIARLGLVVTALLALFAVMQRGRELAASRQSETRSKQWEASIRVLSFLRYLVQGSFTPKEIVRRIEALVDGTPDLPPQLSTLLLDVVSEARSVMKGHLLSLRYFSASNHRLTTKAYDEALSVASQLTPIEVGKTDNSFQDPVAEER